MLRTEWILALILVGDWACAPQNQSEREGGLRPISEGARKKGHPNPAPPSFQAKCIGGIPTFIHLTQLTLLHTAHDWGLNKCYVLPEGRK